MTLRVVRCDRGIGHRSYPQTNDAPLQVSIVVCVLVFATLPPFGLVILGHFYYTTHVDAELYLTKPWLQNNLVWCGQGHS